MTKLDLNKRVVVTGGGFGYWSSNGQDIRKSRLSGSDN